MTDSEELIAERSEAWRSLGLNGPRIGVYGGGAALKVVQPILSWHAEKGDEAYATLRGQLKPYIDVAVEQAKSRRRGPLPVLLQTPLDAESLDPSWEIQILVTSRVQEENLPYHNLMLHGWCLKEVQLGERLGLGRWPLAALFASSGLGSPLQKEKSLDFDGGERDNLPDAVSAGGDVNPHLGIDCLSFSDQHCHWVEEMLDFGDCLIPSNDWHIGSDMARFSISKSSEFASGLVLAIDLETNTGLACFVLIVNDEKRVSFVEEAFRSQPPASIQDIGRLLRRDLSLDLERHPSMSLLRA